MPSLRASRMPTEWLSRRADSCRPSSRDPADDLALQRAQRNRERQRARPRRHADETAEMPGKQHLERERGHAAHRGPDVATSRSTPRCLTTSKPPRRRPRATAPGRSADRCRRCADRSKPGRSSRSSCRASSRRSRNSGACRSAYPGRHLFPPARRRILGARRRMRGRRQAGEDQDRVVARGVELAPGLVGDRRTHAGRRRDASETRRQRRPSCALSSARVTPALKIEAV